MIGQPSVMYNSGASSRCRESEWGGVCSKAFFNDRLYIRMGIALDFADFSEKNGHGKAGFMPEFVDGLCIGQYRKYSFSISKQCARHGEKIYMRGLKTKSGFI